MHTENEKKCLYNTEFLVEIYEQYKEASAKVVSAVVVLQNSASQLEKCINLHRSIIKAFEGYNFYDLTIRQAYRLGMIMYDDSPFETPDENSDFLMLFPAWMFPIIPKDIELIDIFGITIPPFENRKLNKKLYDGNLSFGIMSYNFKYKKVLMEKWDNTQ